MSGPETPTLWRTKLRSQAEWVTGDAQLNYCLENEVVGIGWWAESITSGSGTRKLNALCRAVERRADWGWGRSAARTLRRFATEVQPGDFIWTRDTNGNYRLGKFREGPWEYLNPKEYPAVKAVDLQQQRKVRWLKHEFPASEVPGAVIRNFVGRTSSFQRIKSEDARDYTQQVLWPRYSGGKVRPPQYSHGTVLSDHLDMYEVEDLVFIWLQAELGYMILPTSRQHGTPVFECEMVQRQTGHSAYPQVKTGDSPINWDELAAGAKKPGDKIFAFQSRDCYEGKRPRNGVRIDPAALIAFATSSRGKKLLPQRITNWFR